MFSRWQVVFSSGCAAVVISGVFEVGFRLHAGVSVTARLDQGVCRSVQQLAGGSRCSGFSGGARGGVFDEFSMILVVSWCWI